MVYAPHETLEVHEIAAFKSTCLTKAKTMHALLSDPALKAIFDQDIQTSTRQLQELGAILTQAVEQGIHL